MKELIFSTRLKNFAPARQLWNLCPRWRLYHVANANSHSYIYSPEDIRPTKTQLVQTHSWRFPKTVERCVGSFENTRGSARAIAM